MLEELRQKVSLLPGTNVTIGQPISHRIDHMLSGTRANIAVKIFGDDLPTLRQLGEPGAGGDGAGARRRRSGRRGAGRHSHAEGEGRCGRGGTPGAGTGAVAEALQTARVGTPVGQILEGQIAFPLVVRYAVDDRRLDVVGTTLIQTPDGRRSRWRPSPPFTRIADRTS